MADVVLVKRGTRFFMQPGSQRGVNYIWTTFHVKDIGPADVISFSVDVYEDIKEELKRCKIEFNEL